MKLYPKGIIRVNQPKMTNVRGRTWDKLSVTLLDGTKVHGWMDFTWGRYFYFQLDGIWLRGSNLTWEISESYNIDLRK